MNFILSLVIGFIVNNAVGALVAKLILNPILGEATAAISRKPGEMEMPSLLGGYFLLTLIMVVVYPYFGFQGSWLTKGLVWGLIAGGIVFVSGYQIVAGWAILPPKPMLISGIADSASTIATGIVIAFFHRHTGQ